MASLVATRALSLRIDWINDTIKLMLVDETFVPSRDYDFVSEVVAKEIVTDGYARQTLGPAGKTVTVNKPQNRVDFDAPDVSFGALGAVTPDTIGYGVVFRQQANDATSEVICMLDAADILTAGNIVNGVFPANYVFYLSTA